MQVNINFYFLKNNIISLSKKVDFFWKHVFTRFKIEDFPKGVLKISHVVLGPILLKKINYFLATELILDLASEGYSLKEIIRTIESILSIFV